MDFVVIVLLVILIIYGCLLIIILLIQIIMITKKYPYIHIVTIQYYHQNVKSVMIH